MGAFGENRSRSGRCAPTRTHRRHHHQRRRRRQLHPTSDPNCGYLPWLAGLITGLAAAHGQTVMLAPFLSARLSVCLFKRLRSRAARWFAHTCLEANRRSSAGGSSCSMRGRPSLGSDLASCVVINIAPVLVGLLSLLAGFLLGSCWVLVGFLSDSCWALVGLLLVSCWANRAQPDNSPDNSPDTKIDDSYVKSA